MTTFPQAPLDARVELDLNGTWTNVSTYVYQRNPVVITRGKQDESTTTQPSTLTATLNNQDGRFSAKNPTGPYYGSFGRNTPVRVSVPAKTVYLRNEVDTTSYISTPDSVGLSITGDTDIRLDVHLSSWKFSALCNKSVPAGNQRSWLLELKTDGTLVLFWSADGTNLHSVVSTATVPYYGRFAVRATLAVATGTVTFYTSDTISGSWTQLGAANSGTGGAATSVFNSTAPVVVGDNASAPYGKIYAFQLLSGIGGTTKASPDFTAATAGASTLTDAQSNVWTITGTAEFSNRSYRGHFELSATPQAWDPSGTDVWCDIQAGGLLRRITQNTQTIGSVLYRTFTQTSPPDNLIGYWPCEDGNTTASGAAPSSPTQFASAVQGVAAGTFTGSPTFASDNSFLCSQSIPVINRSRWHFRLPGRSADSANVMRFLLHMPSTSDTNNGVIARMYTTGTIGNVDLVYTTGGNLTLNGYDQNGSSLFTLGPVAFATDGALLWTSVELQTSGGNVQYSITTMQPGAASASGSSGTVAATIGNATELVINGNSGTASLVGTALGQITYQATWETLFDFITQLNAYQGETAGNRFARLCGEQGISCRLTGPANDSVTMGAQTALTFPALLQECVDADRGMIYEPRESLSLGYRSRASLQNQTAAVTLNYATAQLANPIAETEDDQNTQNDVIVTRAYASTGGGTGSSSEVTITSGPLSVQSPPSGVGYYTNSVTQNLYTDAQCYDAAGWMAWAGTVNEPRYPQITVDLARSETLISSTLGYQVQDADIGDRITVTNTPAWLPPDGITQLYNGATETLNAFVYTISWCGLPELPYETGTLGNTVFGVDTDGSTLHSNATSGATSISVDTTAGSPTRVWTTAAGDFPFDILIGGERMTVTNITGASSPQTFTVTRSINGVVKAHTAGDAVSLFYPAILSL